MMEHVLMNFGDNHRILNDSNGKEVRVGIGEIVRADIHPVHARMVQRGIADETMIICDMEFAQNATRKLGQVMECLRDLNQSDYDALLERFHKINGPNPDDLRPTREMLRIALREIARQEVMQMMRDQRMAQRVTIHEQGDERTRRNPDENRNGSPQNLPGSDETDAVSDKTDKTKKPGTKNAAAKADKDAGKGQGKPKSKIKRERL